MSDKRGMFIVFEGIDGCGKGTQMIKLAEHIRKVDKYQDVVLTHEPWRNKEIKRKLAEDKDAYSDGFYMARLYVKDRIEHSEEIEERLNDGYIVLCDRYKMSTCAYQWTQGVDLFKLFKLHEDSGILTPDLTIFIDTPLVEAQKRRERRVDEKEKFEEWEFQKNLLAHYNSLINREDCLQLFGAVEKVNGDGEIVEVAERTTDEFNKYYNSWKEGKS